MSVGGLNSQLKLRRQKLRVWEDLTVLHCARLSRAPSCIPHTIDHVVPGRIESSDTRSYLTQNLSCLAKNIHQYSSVCLYKIYQIKFILFYVLGAPGANMSQNLWILVRNLTGLILDPSGTLGTWETNNIACDTPGYQISGGLYARNGHNERVEG